jgi:hypothetical protein
LVGFSLYGIGGKIRSPKIGFRACVRIGEISRELETNVTGRPLKESLAIDGKTLIKEQQLAAVGISTSIAQRYEKLAGGRRGPCRFT